MEDRPLDGGFAERLRRMPGSSQLAHAGEFDPANDVHVDEAARHLLERFRQHDDLEAFTLLFELTHERLAAAATRICRKLAPAVEPDDLASAFMARLFADVHRRPSEPVRHFLALAHTSMRNDLLDQLRQHKRAQANVRTWHATLRQPPDPAEELQRQEQERAFGRFGRTVLAVTNECFHELDEREQQVLLAREIVALPYERVASMLQLADDQVGMIIRRARVHLVNRIVERLPAAVADGPGSPDADALALVRDTVRRCLGKEGTRNVKGLMESMLEASLHAARARLADLIYEMAKACLVAAPGFSSRTLVQDEPRRSDVVAGDLRQIAARLQRAGGDAVADPGGPQAAGVARPSGRIDIEPVAARRPAPATALDDARACLGKLAELEGTSGRQQVALALCSIHGGQPAEAERVLLPLLDRELPPRTRQNVSRNYTLALLRQDRHAEALAHAEAVADEWPDDPVRVMNICFAAARLRDRARLDRHARLLLSIQRQSPRPRVQGWIDAELRQLASDAGCPEGWLDELAGAVDREPGNGETDR